MVLLGQGPKYIRGDGVPFTFCQPEMAMALSRMDRDGVGDHQLGSPSSGRPSIRQ